MNDYLEREAAKRLGLTLYPVTEDEKVIYIALVVSPKKVKSYGYSLRASAQLAHNGTESEVYGVERRGIPFGFQSDEERERLECRNLLRDLFRELAEVLIDSPAMKGTEK